ncbi:MAG: RidA family protein [Thermoplasmata archaeon]
MAPTLEEWEARLPRTSRPVANYAMFRRSGRLAFTAGVIPMVEGELQVIGKVGREVSLEEGYEASRTCALMALSILKEALGSLSRVSKVLQLVVYVASEEGFTDQPKVADGASDLLVEVFDEDGRPTRLAVGVSQLPLGAPVELSMVVEVSEQPSGP